MGYQVPGEEELERKRNISISRNIREEDAADRRPRIVKELEQLEKTVLAIRETISRLGQRLKHVRVGIPYPAPDSEENSEEPEMSSTVGTIYEIRLNINSAIRDLNILDRELEV
jgi:hypothetical protein